MDLLTKKETAILNNRVRVVLKKIGITKIETDTIIKNISLSESLKAIFKTYHRKYMSQDNWDYLETISKSKKIKIDSFKIIIDINIIQELKSSKII